MPLNCKSHLINYNYSTIIRSYRFPRGQINDLERDLSLSKGGAELLTSRLKNKNLISFGTSFSWYMHQENEFPRVVLQFENFIIAVMVIG